MKIEDFQHSVNPETGRCVMCGKNEFNRKAVVSERFCTEVLTIHLNLQNKIIEDLQKQCLEKDIRIGHLNSIVKAAEELVDFLTTCHQCGARLILEGVANHCQDSCQSDCQSAHDGEECPSASELLEAYRKAVEE